MRKILQDGSPWTEDEERTMQYQISRNGQMYGPYTLEDLQRYVTSGNVLLKDLAKSEEMADWLPVAQVLGVQTQAPPSPAFAGGRYPSAYPPSSMLGANLAASPYPDAPNLHWGLVLLFSLLTCSLFMYVWNLIVAAWLRRVQPNATSLFYYIVAGVLALIQVAVVLPSSMHTVISPGVHMSYNPVGGLVGLLVWIARLVARYSQRASLQEHFNGPEPVGLRLGAVMTFFFGGLYFQYHLNRINELKRLSRLGIGRAY